MIIPATPALDELPPLPETPPVAEVKAGAESDSEQLTAAIANHVTPATTSGNRAMDSSYRGARLCASGGHGLARGARILCSGRVGLWADHAQSRSRRAAPATVIAMVE